MWVNQALNLVVQGLTIRLNNSTFSIFFLKFGEYNIFLTYHRKNLKNLVTFQNGQNHHLRLGLEPMVFSLESLALNLLRLRFFCASEQKEFSEKQSDR